MHRFGAMPISIQDRMYIHRVVEVAREASQEVLLRPMGLSAQRRNRLFQIPLLLLHLP